MSQQVETVSIFINADEIADAASFEQLRSEAAGETATDATNRALTMSELAAAADTKDGTNLSDVLLERVLAENAGEKAASTLEAANARLRNALGSTAAKDQIVYKFNVDKNTGEPISILKQTMLAEDVHATQVSKRQAARVPYGRAHNTRNLGGKSGDRNLGHRS